MPLAFNFFKQRIKVYPINKLHLPKREDCLGVKMPRTYHKNGVDADLIIFTSSEIQPENQAIAWAAACYCAHFDNRRPIAGRLTFNLAKMINHRIDFLQQLNVIIHEITHILGFSSNLYQYYVDKNGHTIGQENFIKKIFLRDKPRLIMATPEVIRVAKEHFQCDSMQGIELEDTGGDGSDQNHWERSTMYNEAMTGSNFFNSAYSKFTLALLKDTGWYDVNYELAVPFHFGLGQGCEFSEKQCFSQKKFREFCENEPDITCDNGYDQKSKCSRDIFTKTEKCNYRIAYLNGDCKQYAHQEEYGDYENGEQYGPNSKCIIRKINQKSFEEPKSADAGCYKADCKGGQINIYIDKQKYSCQIPNQQVFLKSDSDYKGYFFCPDYKHFCANYYPKCPNSCSGKGFCNHGKCECMPGYINDDCSEKSGCKNDCSNNGKCLPNGKCRCKKGWQGNDCSVKLQANAVYEYNRFLLNTQQKNKQKKGLRKNCPDNCSLQGICKQGKCQCNDGWTGLSCSEKQCLNDCYQNGKCIDGYCKCNYNWSGEDCSTSLQNTIQDDTSKLQQISCQKFCSKNGKCVGEKCICNEKWAGYDCSIKKIQCPNQCSGNGWCSDKGKCICDLGFSGNSCKKRLKRKKLKKKKQQKRKLNL